MKKILILINLLASTICSAQTQYSGVDTSTNHSAKVTLSNLALYSEQFDNAAWTNVTLTGVTANNAVAPDGATTAEKVTLSATTNSGRYIYGTAVVSVGNMSARREAVFLKKGTHNFVQLYSQYPNTAYIDVDLNSGTILRSGATNITTFMISVGNGWYYVGFTHTPTSNNALPTITPLKDAVTVAGTSWTSAGTETFYIWGSQVNLASAPLDYLLTTSAAVTLTGVCPSGTSQSYLDPSKCFSLSSTVTAPTDYITAASLSTGAVEKIRESILTRQLEDNYAAGTLGSYINEIKKYVVNTFIRTGSTYEIKKDNGSTTFATGTSTGGNRTPD